MRWRSENWIIKEVKAYCDTIVLSPVLYGFLDVEASSRVLWVTRFSSWVRDCAFHEGYFICFIFILECISSGAIALSGSLSDPYQLRHMKKQINTHSRTCVNWSHPHYDLLCETPGHGFLHWELRSQPYSDYWIPGLSWFSKWYVEVTEMWLWWRDEKTQVNN